MLRKTSCIAVSLLTLQGVSYAEDTDKAKWSGEGAFSAGFTTGNTETTDISLGVKAKRQMGKWALSGEVLGEFGESDGTETRNRQSGALQLDRLLTDKLSVFGKANIVTDEFSGFENRAFLGAGLGYELMKTDKTDWNIRAALGYQYDDPRAAINSDGTVTDGKSEGNLGINAGYDYAYAFNDEVKYSSNGEVIYSDVSTQLFGVSAITAELGGGLSARFSFESRYDTNPPTGFEDTDTVTRVSLVYGF